MELVGAETKVKLAEYHALDAARAAVALQDAHEAAAKAKDNEHNEYLNTSDEHMVGVGVGTKLAEVLKDDEHNEYLNTSDEHMVGVGVGTKFAEVLKDDEHKLAEDLRLLYVQGAERVYMTPREYNIIMKAVTRRIENALVMRLYVNPLNWHCKAFSGKVTPTYNETDVAVPLKVTPLGHFLRIPVVAAQLQAETGARMPNAFFSAIPASATLQPNLK
jgi:hypothetical protein